jgi:hypothetical protein
MALTQDDLKWLAVVRAIKQVQHWMVLGRRMGSMATFIITEIGVFLATWPCASSRILGPISSHLCFSLFGWVKGI